MLLFAGYGGFQKGRSLWGLHLEKHQLLVECRLGSCSQDTGRILL